MQIVYKKTDDLIPYINNARIHSTEQVAQIAASIKEFGFNNPILLDGANGVIAGHGRLLAAQKLKLDKVPCIELSHLSDAEKKAYIIADNKLALNASWDFELLENELKDLKDSDFNVDLTGFDSDEFKELEKEAGKDEEKREDRYTSVINIPQYEITGEKPALNELCDTTKTDELIADIKKADIPQDVKDFLIKAAYRHNAFNYDKVAEYYAHAPKEVQRLMEQSALVIIDLDNAIKNGFTILNKRLKEKYDVE